MIPFSQATSIMKLNEIPRTSKLFDPTMVYELDALWALKRKVRWAELALTET